MTLTFDISEIFLVLVIFPWPFYFIPTSHTSCIPLVSMTYKSTFPLNGSFLSFFLSICFLFPYSLFGQLDLSLCSIFSIFCPLNSSSISSTISAHDSHIWVKNSRLSLAFQSPISKWLLNNPTLAVSNERGCRHKGAETTGEKEFFQLSATKESFTMVGSG